MNINIYNSERSQAICDAYEYYYSLIDTNQTKKAKKVLKEINKTKKKWGF